MPMLYAAADNLTRRLPKLISPKTHAIVDYATIGAFLVAGAVFWRTNRPAARAALVCAGAELALNLLTDYPGGVTKTVGFPVHGKVDLGLAALTATMPELLNFRGGRSFFLAQSGITTAVANLTRFNPRRAPRRRIA
jgi:hypothetical protein